MKMNVTVNKILFFLILMLVDFINTIEMQTLYWDDGATNIYEPEDKGVYNSERPMYDAEEEYYGTRPCRYGSCGIGNEVDCRTACDQEYQHWEPDNRACKKQCGYSEYPYGVDLNVY